MAANIDQPCLVCTYFGKNCVQGCRTSTLFRGDDIYATYRFYSTQPTNFHFNDATKQMLMESTLRFEATAKAKDDVYGITGLILLLHWYLQKNQYYEFLLKHGVLYGYNSASPWRIVPLHPTEGLPSFFFDNSSGPRLPTNSAQPQLPPCAACTYFQRSCSLSCPFAPFFQGDTSQDFRDICAREFGRRDIMLIHTQRRLTESQITQLKATTDYFENRIRSFGDQVYGATGILLSIVKNLFTVNRRIDYLLGGIAFYRHQLRLSLGVRDPGTIQQSRFDDPRYPAILYYNQVTEPYNFDPAVCFAQQRDETHLRQQLVQIHHKQHDKLEFGQHPQTPQYSSETVVQQPPNPAPTNMSWNEMLDRSISLQPQEQTHRPQQLVRQHGQQTQHHQAPANLTSYPQYQNQGGLPQQQQFQHNQLPHQPVPSSATMVEGQHLQHHPSADQNEIWQQFFNIYY